MGVDEQPMAFFLDRAVITFGTRLENDLAKAEQGKKSEVQKSMARNMVMNRWLGISAFADPGKAQRKG